MKRMCREKTEREERKVREKKESRRNGQEI
jgi:hypothetical protein